MPRFWRALLKLLSLLRLFFRGFFMRLPFFLCYFQIYVRFNSHHHFFNGVDQDNAQAVIQCSYKSVVCYSSRNHLVDPNQFFVEYGVEVAPSFIVPLIDMVRVPVLLRSWRRSMYQTINFSFRSPKDLTDALGSPKNQWEVTPLAWQGIGAQSGYRHSFVLRGKLRASECAQLDCFRPYNNKFEAFVHGAPL